MNEVTLCLNRMREGDPAAARELAALVYGDLKARAERLAKNDKAGISATTLVHESYAKLIDGAALAAGGREHFMALASKIMRDLLVDFARRRAAEKRGGGHKRVTISTQWPAREENVVDVLAVNEALAELGRLDERMARIVEMRFFGGMTGEEIAEHLDISRRTVVRELAVAEAWLRKALATNAEAPKAKDPRAS